VFFTVFFMLAALCCDKTKRVFRLCQVSAMSPRRRKAEDADVFAALVRVMHRRGPAELTLREIAAEAGVTAGALVQRFGSKRALLLAHARYGSATGDVGVAVPAPRTAAPLEALRSVTAVHAQLASSPRAALRNLAYLQNDLADPVLHRHLLRMSRAARSYYEGLVADAVAAGELRADTDAQALARSIEVTLGGSFLAWTLYREGAAADWLREDLEATLRPYLARHKKGRRR
jgi:AcrR family transcriptional regulator